MVRGTSYQKYDPLQNNSIGMNAPSIKSKQKRKFRGKLAHTSPVCSSKIALQQSDSVLDEMCIVNSSPVKSKSRRKFKGKLLHTSPLPSNKITKYYDIKESNFQLQENLLISTSDNSIEFRQDFSRIEDQNCKLLQKTNIKFDNNCIKENYGNSEHETNKTESCVPFSPSTALSQLNLNTSKKITKVRKRLIPEDRILKNNSIKVNSKSSNDSYNSVNSQTKLTEFYPVRRSVRKTEKRVLEEKRRTLEEAILSNKEDGLEVRIFEGKGRGIVAARKFYKGEFVVEYAGELITMEEAQKRESVYTRDENIGCYMYYFKHRNQQHCIDATAETDRLGRLLNHSRNGNLSTKTIEVQGIPRLVLIAKEDIAPGCELTYDYGDRSKLSLQYHPWLAQ